MWVYVVMLLVVVIGVLLIRMGTKMGQDDW